MCEILTIKHNNKGVRFGKFDIKRAREDNPDGAGYIIFEKKGSKWFKYDFETFGKPHYSNKHKKKDSKEVGGYCGDGYYTNWYKASVSDKDYCVNRIFSKQFELKPKQMMIAHFRLSTSGHGLENTQPITKGAYTVIHNGVFGYGIRELPKNVSDTAQFTKTLKRLIYKLSNKGLKITPEVEKKAIEQLTEKVGGSFSMFIHSEKTGKIYYIKSAFTSFCNSTDGFLGTTKSTRLPLLYNEPEPKKILQVV